MKPRALLSVSPVLLLAVLGCKGKPMLFDVQVVEPGADCPSGGVAVLTGVDEDKDGTLQDEEVDDAEIVCNGEDGDTPFAALMATSDIPVGDATCPGGGVRLDVGLDDGDPSGTAADGILQDGEIDDSKAVCNALAEEYPSLAPPGGPAGLFTIDASGGAGSLGEGGGGGYLDVGMYYGSFGGGIKVFATGLADAAFTFPTAVSYDLGANPLQVTTTATILAPLDTTGLTSGDLYVLSGEEIVRRWNGTTGDEITGISVAPGATLAIHGFLAASSEYVKIRLDNDFFLGGTLYAPLSGSLRPDVRIDCDTFVGAATGVVDLSGQDNGASPGGAGGDFTVYAYDSDRPTSQGVGGVFNQATIDTSGGAGTTGGEAGAIYLEANLVLYNAGVLTAHGGIGSSGPGGGGAKVALDTDYGSLYSTGVIDASGGDGTTGGGSAGGAYFYNGYVGNVFHSGSVSVEGGDANACSGPCSGGKGGYVDYDLRASRLVSTASVAARGGNATASGAPSTDMTGGSGGYVSASSVYADGYYESSYLPPGDMRFSGTWDLSGGDGPTGGPGGYVDVDLDAGYAADNQQVLFLGYTVVRLAGGDGANGGGNAGYATVMPDYAYGDTWSYGPGGPVVNYADFDLGGGAGGSGSGGDAGYFELFTEEYYGWWSDNEVAINHGDVDLIGGAGASGGDGGTAFLYGYSGVENHGAITCDGGGAGGSAHQGGDVDVLGVEYNGAPGIFLWSDLGDVTNTGRLSASGGSGTTGTSSGGSAGVVELVGHEVVNSGDLYSAGGDGATSGGDGEVVHLLSLYGTTTQSGSVIDVDGGTGTTPGANGVVVIDGMNVTSKW